MAVPLAGILLLLLASLPSAPTAQPHRIWCPVLTYHHVKRPLATDDAIERGLTVRPDQFAAQLDDLRRHGFHTITTTRLVAYLLHGSTLPAHPIALTFDDGYSDVYTHAYPLLLRRHLVASFFIVPGFLGKPRYLTLSQVRDMARHGMDIEAHTMTHPDLTRIGPKSVRWQLEESRRELQYDLGKSVRIMAYPYGDTDTAVEAAVRRAGYIAAFTTYQSPWEDSSAMLTLPRMYALHSDALPLVG